MYKFLLFLILFVSINSIQAQNRSKRPIQLQGNFSGALLSVTVNSLADETVDDVKVNKWRPGIDIGYHINRFVYFGIFSFFILGFNPERRMGIYQCRPRW